MTYSDGDLALIVLDSMLGFEYKHKIKIISLVKDCAELFDLPKTVKDYLFECVGESKAKTVIAAFSDENYHDFVLDGLNKAGTVCITIKNRDYPANLKETDIPPIVLYCNGNTELLKSEPRFAIVGSRKCLPYATALATDFSGTLSKNGVTVVTGSAGGADKAAIDGAIGSGRLICVLAGGINHVYPEYNKSAVEKIAKVGLVVSEQPPDYAVKPWMFPVRNRIIAGLSEGVLIVGGDRESGARHTANYAADYGRRVFAFPYSIGIKTGELNNELIKDGASLCDDVNDILSELGIESDLLPDNDLSGDELDVYLAIKDGFDDIEKIIVRTNKKMNDLAPILSLLEIEGYIVRMAGNKYKTVK